MNEDWVYSRRTRLWSLVWGSHPIEFRHLWVSCHARVSEVIHLITESLILLTNMSNISSFPATSHTWQPLLVTCVWVQLYFILLCMCVIMCIQVCANMWIPEVNPPVLFFRQGPSVYFVTMSFREARNFAEEAGLPVEGSIPSYLVCDRRTSTFHHAQFLCRFYKSTQFLTLALEVLLQLTSSTALNPTSVSTPTGGRSSQFDLLCLAYSLGKMCSMFIYILTNSTLLYDK